MDRQGFCILPFTTLYVENNRVRLCCESEERTEKHIYSSNDIATVWNSDFYKETRQQMLAGNLPDYCRICKLNELAGEESKRQWENSNYTKLIEDINNFNSVEVDSPINFDVRPSNKCNLECVMCNGVVSTAINQRVLQYKKDTGTDDFVIQTGTNWSDNRYIIDYVKQHSDKIRIMKFCGGEPFLVQEVLDIIDHLVETGDAKNIRIGFITNGTVVRSKWFSERLIHFKDVKLNVSLDGVGEIGEYVRYPSKWSVVDSNLKLFKQLADTHKNIRLSLAPVIHLLNALHMDEVLEYAAVNDINIALSPVYQASNELYLSTDLLTDELRALAYDRMMQVIERYPDINFSIGRGFITNLIEVEQLHDSRAIQKLNQAVKYWDSHRDTKFIELYPYLKYLLTDK